MLTDDTAVTWDDPDLGPGRATLGQLRKMRQAMQILEAEFEAFGDLEEIAAATECRIQIAIADEILNAAFDTYNEVTR
jgi:hypothetical protein